MADERAVIKGELVKVSASQLTTFRRCQRKWWLSKVEGREERGTGAQGLGTAIHSQMEEYLENGTPPPHPGAMAATRLLRDDGTAVVPQPKTPGVLVEAALEDPEIYVDGVRYRGFIDVAISGRKIDIIDWKSTKSFSYAKTPEQLRKDIQVGSYGYWAHKRFPEAETLRLSHVYILSRGKSARVVEVEATWDDVEKVWSVIKETVQEMKRVARISHMKDVEPNLDACGDFGGCAHYSLCHSPAEAFDEYEPEEEGTP